MIKCADRMRIWSVGFCGGKKTENTEKNPRSRNENQQTQPTCDAGSVNRTPADHIPMRRPCIHFWYNNVQVSLVKKQNKTKELKIIILKEKQCRNLHSISTAMLSLMNGHLMPCLHWCFMVKTIIMYFD